MTIATTISVASAMIILVLIGWFVSWKQKMISSKLCMNPGTTTLLLS